MSRGIAPGGGVARVVGICEGTEMKLSKMHLAFALLVCCLVAAAVVWAAESAPSNTVGFFTFDLSAGVR